MVYRMKGRHISWAHVFHSIVCYLLGSRHLKQNTQAKIRKNLQHKYNKTPYSYTITDFIIFTPKILSIAVLAL